MGDPTRPTQPLGQPPPMVHERELVVSSDALLEEIRRVRFWSYFGSAVAVCAAVLAGIALIVAVNNDNKNNTSGNTTNAQVESLRSDVRQLQSDVSDLSKTTSDTSDEVRSLASSVRKLEQANQNAATSDDVSKLQQDLNDLSDRVDQVERAQEQAASGGP